jgi:hypothetical protein
MGEQGSFRQRVQDLGQGGAHAGALPRGQYDDTELHGNASRAGHVMGDSLPANLVGFT